MRRRLIAIAVLVIAGAAVLLLRAAGEQYVTFQGRTMGTGYTVTAGPLPADVETEALQAAVEARLDELVAVFSTWEPESEISRLNANASTDWIPISTEFLQVLAEARRLGELTEGALDITVGPLVNLWGFGPEMGEDDIPPETDINAALERVGLDAFSLQEDPPALRKSREDVVIDLSAIAKGYAVDEIAALLAEQGLLNYLVDIGGELRGQGLNQQGEPWRIAIEKPQPGTRVVQQLVTLSQGGLATSGDYRNFFERDGQRYAHVIDPNNGRPVAHRLASVTVLAESAMVADGLATGLMVLGPERALALAEAEALAVFLIEIDGEQFIERVSPAFRPHLLDGLEQ